MNCTCRLPIGHLRRIVVARARRYVMTGAIVAIAVVVVLLVVLVPATVRIVQEYERGVIFRLGRLVGAKGPGLFFIVPFFDRMRKVDLRVITIDVPSQEAITGDNIPVQVNAVIYFRVINPEDAIVQVADFMQATLLIAQTTLRSIVGQTELDQLLSERDQVNLKLQEIIDQETDPWGIKVSAVELRDVEIPENMQRVIARQAEAERERRAKVIHAEGEFQAAQRLADAGRVLSEQPASLQLRYLSTLTEMATEHTSTLVFPLPVDLITSLMSRLTAMTKKSDS
jgi:regulator of protease activity HflC (stomatin/prohibitin superfamily)